MSGMPIEDLRESGLLWLINRVVFHPRGFALGMEYTEDGKVVGWVLQGDGRKPWRFAEGREDDAFEAVEDTLEAARRANS